MESPGRRETLLLYLATHEPHQNRSQSVAALFLEYGTDDEPDFANLIALHLRRVLRFSGCRFCRLFFHAGHLRNCTVPS